MSFLEKAYDAETFRQQGHALIELLADHLSTAYSKNDRPAFRWEDPKDAYEKWAAVLQSGQDSIETFDQVVRESVQLHHPHYMGHQISPPTPISALAGLLSDFLNNGMGVYEMGIPGTAIERVVIRQVASQMGFGPQAEGILTSGGTLANLTALLAARRAKATENVWREGHSRKLALLVSEEAHYCVDRAVRIMGWGEGGIVKVPVNDRYQMAVSNLESSFQIAINAGYSVIAVVGSACSTSTGSFDDLNALADFCAEKGLWLHVDGAHGAATTYSKKYKHLVDGLHRADSVVMDFHKMLLTPSVTTALIFKRADDNYRIFAQRAQYLWEQEGEQEWYNLARRTFECTKTMMSLKAFMNLQTGTPALYDEYVTRVIDLSKSFAHLIKEDPNFELAVEPDCNIVCFRYLKGDSDLNALNESIRANLVELGQFYIVKTILRGQVYLRTTISNPFTRIEDFNELLESIKATQPVIS